MSKKFPTTRYQVEERSVFSGGSVDRSDPNKPKIIGALLNGNVSANNFIGEGKNRQTVAGRRYLAEAFANGRVQRYNGKPIFLNHPAKPTDSRDYRDKIAVVENARTRADGMPIGDLVVNPKNPYAEQFLWDAEHSPNSCGMSHRALFKWRAGTDQFAEAVELEEVLSVDVVVEPATTSGVFEHKEQPVKMKLAQVAEWVSKHPKSTAAQCLAIKSLAESYPVQEMDEPAADSEPGATIDEAFRSLLHAHVDELLADSQTLDDFMKKVKALHKAHKGPEKKEGEEGGESKEDKMAESKQIGLDKAVRICTESKFNATPRQVQLISLFTAESDAKAFVAEEQARAQEVKPRSTGRTVANPPKGEAVQEGLARSWSDSRFKASRN